MKLYKEKFDIKKWLYKYYRMQLKEEINGKS